LTGTLTEDISKQWKVTEKISKGEVKISKGEVPCIGVEQGPTFVNPSLV